MANDVFHIVWHDAAKEDLRRIARYILEELYAPMAASKLEEDYRNAADSLSRFPHRCPLINKKRGIRKCIVRKDWLLFYRVDEKRNIVNIVSVTNGRRNWKRWF